MAWSTEAELQATTLEVLDSLRLLYLQAHVKKGTRLPKPIEVNRPWRGADKPRRNGTTLTELVKAIPVRRAQKGGGE